MDLKKRRLVLISVGYVVLTALTFPYLRHYVDNPDTFEYLHLAKRMVNGEFPVNGYWSPLITWLLYLPMKAGMAGMDAYRLIQFVLGFVAIFSWSRLLNKLNCNSDLPYYFIIPFLTAYGMLNLTPDFLFLVVTLEAVNAFLENDIKRAAVFGVLMYYAKAFGLPMFVAMLFFHFILFRRATPEKKKYFTALILFAVSVLPYVILLSQKYGRITISESSRFNRLTEVAPLPSRGDELPILEGGLYIPSPGELSAWEEPGKYLSGTTLIPVGREQVFVIKRNLLSIYYSDIKRQPGFVFLILMFVFLIIKRKEITRQWLFLVLIIFTTYFAYSLIVIHSRYVWINHWLMFSLSVMMISVLLKQEKFRSLVILLLVLFYWKRPVKEILFTGDFEIPSGWIVKGIKNPRSTMEVFYREDKNLDKEIELFRNEMKAGEKFVTIKSNGKADRDQYAKSLRLAYETDNVFYGLIDSTTEIPSDVKSVIKFEQGKIVQLQR